jgi:hypothetical protein
MTSVDAVRPAAGSSSLWLALAGLSAAVVVLAWDLADGPGAPIYLGLYALAVLPGLPVGFALFGRRHAAGWIAGALIGYGLTAVALWLPIQARVPTLTACIGAWALTTALSFAVFRRVAPMVALPRWTRRDTLALVLVLMAVPALLWKPFSNIGDRDDAGNLRYRAYFTADFLWHIALTAELARMQSPPRNPYLARRPLHYYWAYFVLPAVASRAGVLPSIQARLTVNALCAGLLFVSAIFIAAWCAVPRAGPVAAATLVAILAASAEGVFAIWRAWQHELPIESLRHLNIDAMTSWVLRGLTIDGLPRSLWYTPQHAAACALSLVASIVPAYAAPRRATAGLLAGLALGLALIFSPFLGGAFSLIYGLTSVWLAVRSRAFVDHLITTAPAALPVAVALGWCLASGTFEGAGGAVGIGLSRLAVAAPFMGPILALGPLLVLSLPALGLGRRFGIDTAVVSLLVGFGMFYFVSLRSEPIWIGWRAGQILLVTMPALAAATIAALIDRGMRWVVVASVALAVCVGLPTTLVDAHNAQDVDNARMGPGFAWTVKITPDTRAAVEWIRHNTATDSIVQMSIGPRGRETWTLIPTFAERRMAAGQPISLLRAREYDERTAQADTMFRTTNPADAWAIARALRVDFVYLDAVERQAFEEASIAKFSDRRFFTEVFRQDAAAVYAVR